ncbi:DNA-protecting protein DprA [Candidatus Peregrinibacteria bacterium]|nr:DNA-protecting protein DprA [Candidatus Peregrinibacteria bacterium]
MLNPAALTWSALNILTKQRYDAIREVFGDLENALKHVNEEFLRGLGCRQETITNTLLRLEEFDADAYAKDVQKRGIKFVTIDDPDYPAQLKEIGDPPVFLYYKGDLSLLEQPCIALVGTREMSPLGKQITDHMVSEFVSAGMVTVSGLAQGIDAEVARETIAAGRKTVAVLGHGLRMIFPTSNAKLAEKILETGGLILSEFALDIQPDKYTFPSRNRIIAGLSLGTVVLEAPVKSGSIITAELALEYNRDVFAVPGHALDPQYGGCNELIAKGHAKLVTTAREVLMELGIVASEKKSSAYAPQNDHEEKLLNILTSMPQPIDDLLEKTKLDPGTLSSTLTMMELAGAAKNVGGGKWVRA